MPDFKKMTVSNLRDAARKLLGSAATELKTKAELVSALEQAEAGAAARARTRRTPSLTSKAARAVRSVTAKTRPAAEEEKPSVRSIVVRAGKGAAVGAAVGASVASRGKKQGKVAQAAAAVAGAAVGAVVGAASAARRGAAPATARRPAAGKAAGKPAGKVAGKPAGRVAGADRGPEGATDPEGYFVARVRGENAVREAPHPMLESALDTGARAPEGSPVGPLYDERLGELPWTYGDDTFMALPRDPRTLFLYWDHAEETRKNGFEGLEHARTQLWVFARAGASWERVRVLDFALESRGYYVHDLEPGRVYRAEIHLLDRQGRDRLLAGASNLIGLPPFGPSSVVDDRFLRLPWDVPFGRLLGAGHAGAPFSEEARAALARLSDWSRFQDHTAAWGGSAGLGGPAAPGGAAGPAGAGGPGGLGARPSSPSSPSSPWGGPTSPSSPFGPFGGGDR